MKRSISLVLSASLITVMLPRQAEAHEHVADASHDHNPEAASTTLMFAGTVEFSNGWVQTYSVYTDDETGDVWGDGYVHDPESLDVTGSAGRWLSYTHHNGEFDFLGSDDGERVRTSFGPDDVTWTQDEEGGWEADIASPNSGPQPLWPVIALAVVVAVAVSGDSGCSCGHNGGTDNHPGSNPPED